MLGSFALIFDNVSKILDSTRPVSSSAFSSSVVSSEELLARSSSSRILSRNQLKGSMNFQKRWNPGSNQPAKMAKKTNIYIYTVYRTIASLCAAQNLCSSCGLDLVHLLIEFLGILPDGVVISDQNWTKNPFLFGVSTRSSQRNWTQLIQNMHGSSKSLRN